MNFQESDTMIRLWEKCVIPHLTPLDRDLYSTVERLQVCICRWTTRGLNEKVLKAAASVQIILVCVYACGVSRDTSTTRTARRRKVRSYL